MSPLDERTRGDNFLTGERLRFGIDRVEASLFSGTKRTSEISSLTGVAVFWVSAFVLVGCVTPRSPQLKKADPGYYTRIGAQVSQNAVEGKSSLFRGSISDGDKPIPFADLVLHHLNDEGRESTFESNAQGEFEFVIHTPGKYSVEFFYGGFLPAHTQELVVGAGDCVTINAVLEREPVGARPPEEPLGVLRF